MLLLVLPLATFASSDWRLEKTQEKVEFFLRDYPGSSIPEFKAVTQIPTSMTAIVAVLLDVESYPKWVHRCRESFTLETVDTHEKYVYQVNRLPFARDRDLILHAELSRQSHEGEIVIHLEAAPDYCERNSVAACDRIEPDRYLRIEESEGSYRLAQLDENTVEVTWQQYLDPGGRLPGWLVRRSISTIPINTLNALHEMVKRPEYRDRESRLSDRALPEENPESR